MGQRYTQPVKRAVILGPGGVGKTTLAETHQQGKVLVHVLDLKKQAIRFTALQDSYCFDFMRHGKNVALQVIDFAGQEQFVAVMEGMVTDMACAAVVVDVSPTHNDTIDDIPQWVTLLPKDIPTLLVGNKTDLLPAAFDVGQVQEYMDRYRFEEFMLTSALDLASVSRLFNRLADIAFLLPHKGVPVSRRRLS
jgi:small GTP-binding protein